ncbi:MAG: hypothetical protein NVV70_14440 [Cellulomonas sp.]|uniref:Uncharacterized protein n=1 Tax=Cellulomonas gelida TaxID=1712 RepID=A0A4Y3KJE4_9CELL|nr:MULTISPECIES: hypothetical protein [Cellulomonas]KMM45421.1 hypothetical protein CWIS_11080 [Cellulomonas sp. A375-1]MCR6649272.1 hypothetical protein [Cellulomonas sp.]MCR6705258.1 hypothetical protein [Cellulomonas sp.]GEA84147.1 hypothetical protein CGE01nite_13980 [Cellulomonas gelida]GGL19722.1 hypothetical protein GCM10009774_07490 [Cellulomonas gelida]
MTWVLLLVLSSLLPALLFGAVWSLFPGEEETPRWRAALARRFERWAHALRHEPPVTTNPFDALWVQDRLTKVADHVRQLESDTRGYARAERIIASQLAYDQLLAKACGLAGVQVVPSPLGDPAERFREEVELASRGWSW